MGMNTFVRLKTFVKKIKETVTVIMNARMVPSVDQTIVYTP